MQNRPKLRTARTLACRANLRGETLEERLPFSAGQIDTTFGGTGLVSIHPGANGFADEGYSVATQADGKVVVAGTAWTGVGGEPAFDLVRYNEDGTLDTSFGTGGQVITPVSTGIQQGRIYGLIVEPDQKIVVSGDDGSNMEVARYNTDGTLDTTFGTGGIVTVPGIGANFTDGKGEALAVQADGKYVITGQSISLQFQYTWPVVRLNHDGSVDTTFGTGGLANGPVFPNTSSLVDAWDVIVQSDQKIVVVGDILEGQQWQIARYNSDGTLDTTFGTGGVATVNLTLPGQDPFQVVQQTDGKLLIVGTAFDNGLETQSAYELMRLNTDGSLDSTFNGGQPIQIGVPGEADSQSFQVAVQPDGKILLGGLVEAMAGTGIGNFAVQRYNSDGTLDTTYGNGGTAMTSFNETFNNWGLELGDTRMGMALEPDGSVVVMSLGRLTLNDQDYSWVLARFTGDPPVLPAPTVTVSDAGGVYNNKPFPGTATVNGGASLEGVAPTLAYYAGSTTTGTSSSTAPTAAGTYTVVANFAGSTDYAAASSNPVTFVISQAIPTVAVSDFGGAYSGSPIAATATVNGSSSLEGISPTLAYYVGNTTTGTPSSTAPTTVGTYTVVANFAGSADYLAAASNPVTFVISQAMPTVTVSDAGGTYNGNKFPATATVNGQANLEGVTPTLAYYAGSSTTGTPSSTAPTAAGTYTVVANFAGSADYLAASSSPVTFVIGTATPTVTVSDAGGNYNGTPYPATASVNGGASLEGVAPTLAYYVGSVVTDTPSPIAPTAVGTYTVVATFAGSANYSAATSSPVTFNIVQANLSASITSVTPNPRNTSVDTMTITFSEPVFGFSLSNLQLSLNGGPNLLTASQTLTTANTINWTLNNLTDLTAKSGNYVLTLSASGVHDGAGNTLISGVVSGFEVIGPQQNKTNPLDVNDDGVVSPTDALVVINYLNSFGTETIPKDTFLDVNGDGTVSPIDALTIINYLDTPAGGTAAVASAAISTAISTGAPPATAGGAPGVTAPAPAAAVNGSLTMGVSLSTSALPAVASGSAQANFASSGTQAVPAVGSAAGTSAGLNQAAVDSLLAGRNRQKAETGAQPAAVDAALSQSLLDW